MKLFKYLFLLTLAGIIIGAKSIEPSTKYNILFIVADDLNCSIGAYGDPLAKTPNLDRLAKEGLIFSDAHVQYPLCGPSRVSFMTGLYPDQTKSKRLRLYVRQTIPDVVTLGQKFRTENYHSVRVGKIYHYHNPRDIGTAELVLFLMAMATQRISLVYLMWFWKFHNTEQNIRSTFLDSLAHLMYRKN